MLSVLVVLTRPYRTCKQPFERIVGSMLEDDGARMRASGRTWPDRHFLLYIIRQRSKCARDKLELGRQERLMPLLFLGEGV
jgi:hypothetical protein